MLCTRSATSRTTEVLGRTAGVRTRCCAASPSSVIRSANRRSQCARRTTAGRAAAVLETFRLMLTSDTKHIPQPQANAGPFCALAAGSGVSSCCHGQQDRHWAAAHRCAEIATALSLLALGVGLLSLPHRDAAEAVRHWTRIFSSRWLIDERLAKVVGVNHQTMRRLGVGTLSHATVFGIVGEGLRLAKTWPEYMPTCVTISFLPIEAYELVVRASGMKALATLGKRGCGDVLDARDRADAQTSTYERKRAPRRDRVSVRLQFYDATGVWWSSSCAPDETRLVQGAK